MKLLVLALVVVAAYAVPAEESAKDFSVHAVEKGNPVEEKVHVDPINGIEVFYVPHHNELDEMYQVHDFVKKYTLRVFPGKKMCYLSRLQYDEMPTPKQLIASLRDHAGLQDRVKHVIMQDWAISGSNIVDRSFLSPKMVAYCAGFPMQMLEPMPELVTIEENKPYITKSGTHDRQKRQLVISNCPPNNQRSACIMRTHFCTYVRVCKDKFDYQINNQVTDCGTEHRYGRATCCNPCCTDKKLQDTKFHPFCGDKNEKNIKCG